MYVGFDSPTNQGKERISVDISPSAEAHSVNQSDITTAAVITAVLKIHRYGSFETPGVNAQEVPDRPNLRKLKQLTGGSKILFLWVQVIHPYNDLDLRHFQFPALAAPSNAVSSNFF